VGLNRKNSCLIPGCIEIQKFKQAFVSLMTFLNLKPA
jgi:hypothetical protein